MKQELSAAAAMAADGAEGNAELAASARRWLETAAKLPLPGSEGSHFSALPLRGIRVIRIGGGRSLCSFTVPRFLTDRDGRWHSAAIAALVDEVGANTIKTIRKHSCGGERLEGEVSVQVELSHFSAAKAGDEVEIEGRAEHSTGRAVAAVVEIRKKESGARVATGRLWMLSVSFRSKI